MKKVVFLLSTIAALGFVSCQKQSLGYGNDELELVIEELEGSATKAALTKVNLDKYGAYNPSSQVLTARLQYAKTGEKVSGEVEYTWHPDLKGCALPKVNDRNNSQNTLTATKAGSGTISVSATYKGQDVQSSDLPVTVTENELVSIRLDISTTSDGQNKFVWVNGASTYSNTGMGWNGPKDIYYMVLDLYAVFNTGNSSFERNVRLWSYDDPNSPERQPELNPDVTISLPDLPESYYIRSFTGSTFADHSGRLFYYPKPVLGYSSGLIGDHQIKVNYKGKTDEKTIQIKSDYNYANSSYYDEYKIVLWQGKNDYTITNGGSVNLNTNDFSFKVFGGAHAESSQALEELGYLTVVLSKSNHTGDQVLTRRGWDNAEGGPYNKPVFGAALSAGNYVLQIFYLNQVLFSCTLRVS